MSEARSVTATFTSDPPPPPPPPSRRPKLEIEFQGPKSIRAGKPFRIWMTVSNEAPAPTGCSVTRVLRAKTVRSASRAITFLASASGSNAEGAAATAARSDRIKVTPTKKPKPPTG